MVMAGNRMWNDIVNANCTRARSNAAKPNMKTPRYCRVQNLARTLPRTIDSLTRLG
jgi:hypothetical protein